MFINPSVCTYEIIVLLEAVCFYSIIISFPAGVIADAWISICGELQFFYIKIMISSGLFLKNMTFTSHLQVQMFLIDPVVIKDINQACSLSSERGEWIQCSFYARMERAMPKWCSCYSLFSHLFLTLKVLETQGESSISMAHLWMKMLNLSGEP